ncbi:hypothetical protein ACHAXA_003118 [Cyclostephanos tholiformis]|uniref:Uncharacterized protein n=1 Tax=Cyclostephanos tholiformis TaxID=382380 RepID=A0ABD3SS08_9STRA
MTTNSYSEHYRRDGVRITHDPYAPGMAEKYGTPGRTDGEGFDPYADSVVLEYTAASSCVIHPIIRLPDQDHNPHPGPVYAGGGYALSTLMLEDAAMLTSMLDKFPDLANDVTTGGAQSLHMCGMSPHNQHAARYLVEHDADIEALDTYGMTPLQRMASNNLATGARVLLEAGADFTNVGKCGRSPLHIARGSAANDVGSSGSKSNVIKLIVTKREGAPEVGGEYHPRSPVDIPKGFAAVCEAQGWDILSTWARLNGVDPRADTWFAHSTNDSYIYHNKIDGKWWIDGPDGKGVWVVDGPTHAPPSHGWTHMKKSTKEGGPKILTIRKLKDKR